MLDIPELNKALRVAPKTIKLSVKRLIQAKLITLSSYTVQRLPIYDVIPCSFYDAGDGYRRVSIPYRWGSGYKDIAQHRAIWSFYNGVIPEGYVIDQINGVRDDNRTENLRLATPAQNATNKSTKSKATSKSATGY